MNTTIVVRDIPTTTTDEEFSNTFSTAVSATIKRDKQGICRGFAFVVFATKETANKTITEINSGIVTPFGILRAELSNGGQTKKNRQKSSKKKKQNKGDSSVNLCDIGRFRSRRGNSKRLHPGSTTISAMKSHTPSHFQQQFKNTGHGVSRKNVK